MIKYSIKLGLIICVLFNVIIFVVNIMTALKYVFYMCISSTEKLCETAFEQIGKLSIKSLDLSCRDPMILFYEELIYAFKFLKLIISHSIL